MSGVYNTLFNHLIFESVKYIHEKNITPREKLTQLEEMGSQIGERIVYMILNKNYSRNKLSVEDVVILVSDEVWRYLFNKKVSKPRGNKKGNYYFDVDDINLFYPLIKDKSPTSNDMLLTDYLLTVISGIIKGSLGVFDIQCLVNGTCKLDLLFNEVLSKELNGTNNVDEKGVNCCYVFNINILSN